MKDKELPRKALKGYTEGRRPVGRPRGRWIDAIDKDAMSTLKYKNCSRSAEDKET
jgi:hypothetical protein